MNTFAQVCHALLLFFLYVAVVSFMFFPGAYGWSIAKAVKAYNIEMAAK